MYMYIHTLVFSAIYSYYFNDYMNMIKVMMAPVYLCFVMAKH